MVGETPVDYNKGVEFKSFKCLEKLQLILIKGRGFKTLNDWRNSSVF